MADADFSLLDVPRDNTPEPLAYLRSVIAWHFGADTGSPFWLRIAGELEFDPLTEVRTFADLRKFPNLVDRLRDVAVEDLIPRGYGSPLPTPRVFESGGTTGAPKRTAQLPDWLEQVTRWQVEDFSAGGFIPNRGLLCMMPSGPHGVGYFDHAVADRLGATFHAIDLDPRWVKKIAARNDSTQVDAYLDHVLDQARFVLDTQDVANMHATPPMIEALAADAALVDLINSKVRYLLLSGAHVDRDTLDVMRNIFPDTAIAVVFGSTMILSQAATRIVDHTAVFDPRSPYVVFWVIDPDSGEQVDYGQRGQVVMNHLSKGMFIPNNLERDTALRWPGPEGHQGDSISDVAPVAVFGGEPVIEGVY